MTRHLAIELCYPPDGSPQVWTAVLCAIRAAEPRLIPHTIERPGETEDEPWQEMWWDELAQVCAGEPLHTRKLIADAGMLRVACREDEVRLSLRFEQDGDPSEALIRVVTSLANARSPELALAFDPSSPDDDELLFQGRGRLDRVPPIFYLDRTGLAALGGLENARARAPGDVRVVPRGLLFVVRTTLWSRKTRDDLQREKAMQTFLGLTRMPLALAAHDHIATGAGEPRWNIVREWPWSDEGLWDQTWLGCGDGTWIVGELGTIAHWDGLRWNVVVTNRDEDLFAVVDLSEADAWAVGADGTILRWDGHAWSGVASPTTNTLFAIWASAPNRIFAAGENGTILHWDGRAWTAMRTDTDVEFRSITGAGDTVWVVGTKGTIMQWNGTSWARVESPIRSALDGVHAVSEDDVWAAGLEGTILRLHTGRWTVFESETTADLRSIWARNDRDVWVAGDDCTLRHWNGAAWTALHDDTNPGASLFRVWPANNEGVWVVGNKTTIVLAFPG